MLEVEEEEGASVGVRIAVFQTVSVAVTTGYEVRVCVSSTWTVLVEGRVLVPEFEVDAVGKEVGGDIMEDDRADDEHGCPEEEVEVNLRVDAADVVCQLVVQEVPTVTDITEQIVALCSSFQYVWRDLESAGTEELVTVGALAAKAWLPGETYDVAEESGGPADIIVMGIPCRE